MAGKDDLFSILICGYMYGANYRVLQEMGADAEILKAFGKYQDAPFGELKKVGELVAAWQQVRIVEITKDGYLEVQRQQEQAKADFNKEQKIGIFKEPDKKKMLS